MVFFAIFLVLIVAVAGSSLKVLSEHERAVIYTLGAFSGVKGPGVVFVIPVAQQMLRMSLKPQNVTASADVTTTDNLPLKVDAQIAFHILSPEKAANNVADYLGALTTAGAALVRETLSGRTRGDVLATLEHFAPSICVALAATAAAWESTFPKSFSGKPGREVLLHDVHCLILQER